MARFLKRSELDRQTPAGSAYTVQFQFDPGDLRKLTEQLQKWPEEIRYQIVRKGLHKWGQGVIASARRHAYAKAHNTKRHIRQKTKLYKSGVIWSAIGVEMGFAAPKNRVAGRFGDQMPGWRAHFYELGWTPYGEAGIGEGLGQAARAAQRKRWKEARRLAATDDMLRAGKGKAWRKGLRRRTTGQTRRYATRFMRKAYAANEAKLEPILTAALDQWVRKVNGG